MGAVRVTEIEADRIHLKAGMRNQLICFRIQVFDLIPSPAHLTRVLINFIVFFPKTSTMFSKSYREVREAPRVMEPQKKKANKLLVSWSFIVP